VIIDLIKPGNSFLKQLLAGLAFHHGLKFGIEDLPEMLKTAGFFTATQLSERFLVIGFVRAIKLAA
jgi:hypothetical protein